MADAISAVRTSQRDNLLALLAPLPVNWCEASHALGVRVVTVPTLPTDAAFAADPEGGLVCAPETEEGQTDVWAVWAGLTLVVAHRHGLEKSLSDICHVATELELRANDSDREADNG